MGRAAAGDYSALGDRISTAAMSKLEIVMKRDDGCLRPYGDAEWEKFDKVRTTKPVIVTVHHARNPEHTAKLWAIATKVANFDPEFQDARDAVEWAKEQIPSMHTREVKVRKDGTMEVRIRTNSIAEASMDQIEFNDVFDKMERAWAERIGCDPEELR